MATEVERRRAVIRAFILDRFYVPVPVELADDASLLERGVVDSTGVQEVMAFLEEEFGIRVDNDDILPENLDSIDRLAGYVQRKVEGARGGTGVESAP